MANESWEISIQVMEEQSLEQQVDRSNEITVEQLVTPLLPCEETFKIDIKEELESIPEVTWPPNLSDLCRLCAQEASEAVLIFGPEGVDLQLPELISHCLPVKVFRDDTLPQVACRACVTALQQSDALRRAAKEADATLRRILGHHSKTFLDLPEEEVLSQKRLLCGLCRQHYDPMEDVRPHIITIGTIDVTSASEELRFDPECDSDERMAQEDCQNVPPPSENKPEEENKKPKRKYNTRRTEELPPLKESKLRPRKKSAKRPPPKERAPLPEVKCPQCSSVFHKRELLCRHVLLQHKAHMCPDCDLSFEQHDALAAHTLEAHDAVVPPERYHHPPGTPPVCSFCHKQFKSISGLCHHVDSLHLKIPGNFLCNQCGKPFYGKKKLELHMMRHTGIKTVMCQDCGKMFYNESTLKIHSEMHSVARKYSCTHAGCDKTFKHWRNLYAHMHTVHGRKWNYACNVCPESFKTSDEALDHYESHSPEEKLKNETGAAYTQVSPFECRICFKHYNSQLHYANHMRTHESASTLTSSDAEARNFECPTCLKRFKSKHYLKIHLGVHMTMKPFCCQYCGKSFITKMLLQTHERIHTNETPFRCETCGKGFRAQKKLQIHKRDVHDKIKNFLCLTCGKAFSRKNHLDAHIRTHTNERPYQCDICGQGFKQVGDMRRHVARHQNQPLFKPFAKSSPYKPSSGLPS